MKKLLVFSLITLTFSSCKISQSLIQLGKKSAKVYDYEKGGKDIKFIPIHHLGKKAFYDDVAKKIKENKANGYSVYYELVSTDFTTDSLLKDTIRRKVRKLKGFHGTYKDNAEGTFLDKYVMQPDYEDLGTDKNDKRADVDYLQLINQWEKVNGKIILDSIDLNTPFGEEYDNKLDYSQKQFRNIFVGYRNEHLIKMIEEGLDDKILVVYGAGHRKDFKRKIKDIKQ